MPTHNNKNSICLKLNFSLIRNEIDINIYSIPYTRTFKAVKIITIDEGHMLIDQPIGVNRHYTEKTYI